MKNESIEPTNWEIMDAMQKGFAYTEARFDLMDARIEQRFGQVDNRFERVDYRFDQIESRLSVVERTVGKCMVSLSELQEDFATLSVAFDKDAERIVNHAQRIERLEELVEVA